MSKKKKKSKAKEDYGIDIVNQLNDDLAVVIADDKIALAYNQGKLRYSLLYYPAVEEMVKVLEHGAEKYAVDNWKLPMSKEDNLNSLQRHLKEMFVGNDFDDESGLSHAGHLMIRAMFYYYHLKNNSFYEQSR